MDKTYAISTSEYQEAQEMFFSYNVVGNMTEEAKEEE